MKKRLAVAVTAGALWVLTAPTMGTGPVQAAAPTDGRIVFSAPPSGDSEDPYDIFVMDADGTDVVNLTQTPAVTEAQPSWSPDGTQILYTGQVPDPNEPGETQGDIFSMDADGTDATNLTQSDASELWGSWSPEAGRIAFARVVDGLIVGNRDIFAMDVGDPSSATNLTQTEADELFPAWSPVDERIMFTGVRDVDPDPNEQRNDWEVLTIESDGTNEQNLTASDDGLHEDWSPDWSPDGTKIVWMAQVNCCSTGEDEQWDVWAMNSDGTGRSNLTQNPAGDWFPSWSSDGSGIVFSSNRAEGFRFDMYTMPAPETLPLSDAGTTGTAASALLTTPALARGIPASRVTDNREVSDPDWWMNLDCTVRGTARADVLAGTPGDDVICGRAGEDSVKAGPGNDVILAGSGDDEVRTGSGNDLISLGKGSDWTRGGTDDDVLRGGRGHDFLNAEDKTRNNDIAFGGAASDRCLKDRRDYLDSCR